MMEQPFFNLAGLTSDFAEVVIIDLRNSQNSPHVVIETHMTDRTTVITSFWGTYAKHDSQVIHVYETVIFGGMYDGTSAIFSSKNAAEIGHYYLVGRLQRHNEQTIQ